VRRRVGDVALRVALLVGSGWLALSLVQWELVRLGCPVSLATVLLVLACAGWRKLACWLIELADSPLGGR